MKNSLKYLKLWQQKRAELPINDDPKADWLQMQSLLDQQMPANSGAAGRSSGFKALKLLPRLFVVFSAAAMTYTVSHTILSKGDKQQTKYRQHHHSGKVAPADSSEVADSVVNVDSAVSPKQSDTVRGTGLKAIESKSPAKKSLTVGDSKTGASILPGSSTTTSIGVSKRIPAAANHKPGGSAINNLATWNNTSKGQLYSQQVNRSRMSTNTMSNYRRGANNPAIRNNDNSNGNNNAREESKTAIYNDMQSTGYLAAPVSVTFPGSTLMLNSSRITALPGYKLPVIQQSVKGDSKITKTKKDKKAKELGAVNHHPLNIEWGLLAGVNSSGSFTPSKQNTNFYGSAPVDLFFGVFAAFKINDNWGINPQVKLFSPQTINTAYTHANTSKVDSAQSLKITASRKVYAVSVPVYLTYKVNSSISLKAGPVINFPVKQTNTNSTLQPTGLKSDSAYYSKITGILANTQYQQSINLGFSTGASLQYKRLRFEATYLKSISGYKVTNDLGSYRSNNGTFQITVGFRLNKSKSK